MAESWKLTGTYFESCNCETLCPCIFLSPPTEGECTALLGWHVGEGRFGEQGLDGLNVALAVHAPGNLSEVPWRVALYLDERASEAQCEALTLIYTGQAGGHFEVLASHIGEVLGIKSAAIDYRIDGKRQSLTIADIAETDFAAIEGQDGGEATFSGHPFAVAPGHTVVVARARRLSFHDHGLDWELTNKNAFYSDFGYEGP